MQLNFESESFQPDDVFDEVNGLLISFELLSHFSAVQRLLARTHTSITLLLDFGVFKMQNAK